MTKTAANVMDMDRADVLGAGLLGVGAGLGARTVKRLYELYKGKDYRPPVDLPKVDRPVVKMPIQLTPEEAAELEAQGQHVRHVKAAVVNTAMDYLLTGGLLAGGAYAGWKGLDSYFDEQRKALAKKKLEHARERVSSLLSDKPAINDIALHAQMKAAEDHYFAKEAGDGLGDWWTNVTGRVNSALSSAGKSLQETAGNAAKNTAIGATNMIAPILLPTALLGTLLAVRAYRKSDRANKYQQSANAIKSFYNRRSVQPTEAELDPIVVDKPVMPKPQDHDPIQAAQPLAKAAALGDKLKARLHGRLS